MATRTPITHANNGGTSQVDVGSVRIVEQLRQKLDALASQQQELNESREEVLINREDFMRKGKQVRAQRDRTATAEVILMNALRKHYTSIGSTFPAELHVAYSAVDVERNRLGVLEAEYLETEENLGAQEWTFLEKENDLYQYDLQQLLSDETIGNQDEKESDQDAPDERSKTILPSALVQYQATRAKHGRLVDRFKAMRRAIADILDTTTLSVDEADLLDLTTSDFALSFSDLLTQIADCEVRLQHLKGERIYDERTPRMRSRRVSEPLPLTKNFSATSETVSRARSDGTLSDPIDQIPVIQRIREWLLDCLKQSAVQKTQYLSILQQTLGYIDFVESDFSDWEVLAAQEWSLDDATDPGQAGPTWTFVPSTRQQSNQEIQPFDRFDLEDQQRIVHEVAGTDLDGLEFDHSTNLVGDLVLPSSDTPAFGADEGGFASTASPPFGPADAQSDASSRWEKHKQVSTFNMLEHETVLPIVNPALIPNPFVRSDSVQGSIARQLKLLKLSINPSDAQRESVERQRKALPDPNDALSQCNTAIMPKPELVYSPWKWPAELQRFYVFSFGADDHVSEAFQSDPVALRYPPEFRTIASPTHSIHHEPNDWKYGGHSHEAGELMCAYPTRCPWINFYRSHMVYPDFRYHSVPELDQPRFYTTGKVFSTLRLNISEKDGPLSNLMALRNRSGPANHNSQPWYQFCFVVVQNKGTFSQCLSIQSLLERRALKPSQMLDWGIIHTSEQSPAPFPWERSIKEPLRVQPTDGERLPLFPRIYYGKTFPIEHKYPVLEIGSVSQHEINRLLLHYTTFPYQSRNRVVEEVTWDSPENTTNSVPFP